MEEIRIVRQIEHIRLFAHPLKVAILRELVSAPRSIGEIAGRIGEPANKLHYHIAELEHADLVRVAITRQKGHLTEKVYTAVARNFRFDWSLAASDSHGTAVKQELILGTLDSLRSNLLQSGEAELDQDATKHIYTQNQFFSLTAAQYDRLLNQLQATIQTIIAEGNRVSALEQPLNVQFGIVMFPFRTLPTDSPPTDAE